MKRSRKIAYLLESTALCGGVKVVLNQAKALIRKAHQAVVLCPEPFPDWFEYPIPFEQMDFFKDYSWAKEYDIIIGTTPRILLSAFQYSSVKKKLWHLVQGYEEDYSEAFLHRTTIRKAYSLPVPKITVSERLAERLRRIYPECNFYSIGQGLERDLFFPPAHLRHKRYVERVILIGALHLSIKQIHLGLRAYELLKNENRYLQLMRISPIDSRDQEEDMIGKIDEYYVNLTPTEVGTALRRRQGVFLSPSSPGEGFGLPALEAMASGIPAVLTDIPSYNAFSFPKDYALFVPYDNFCSMAGGIRFLINNQDICMRMVQRGLEVAAQYSYDMVAESMEKIFYAL